MFTRILLATFMSAAAVTALTGCQRPSSPPPVITATSEAPVSAAPTGAALTRQACELLTPEVAKKYAALTLSVSSFFSTPHHHCRWATTAATTPAAHARFPF